jgi:hypothetical protein
MNDSVKTDVFGFRDNNFSYGIWWHLSNDRAFDEHSCEENW